MRTASLWLNPTWFALAACGAPPGAPSPARAPDAAPADAPVVDAAPAGATVADAPETAPVADMDDAADAADATEAAADLSATERALAQLSAAYGELAERFGDEPGNAISWAEADIESLGDWEYRVVVLPDGGPPAALEEALNLLGQERWEAYWMESSRDGLRVFLKRPSISFLSRVPLSTLVRMLTGGGQ